MANPKERYDENVEGRFFVDRTCINCDTCRQLAPQIFSEKADHSFVCQQPQSSDDERAATRALLCCPTGSIGTIGPNQAKETMNELPLELIDGVYYCGFNSPKSYGGNSYFIEHKDGNWLIDSPKFLPHLVKRFEQLGGIKYIFLTHRDDIADAAKYATAFGAKRIVHSDDADSAPGSEIVLDTQSAQPVSSKLHGAFADAQGEQFTIIPTPGHTKGHMVLLYKNQFLFTGDHLAFDRDTQQLEAFRDFCWYSWKEQIESMAKLSNFSFNWIFPGHGQRIHLHEEEMHRQMVELVARMQS